MVRMQILIVVLILSALSGALFAYKVTKLGFPVTPNQDQSEFYVEARVSFTGGTGPVSVKAALPNSAAGFAVLETDALATGFGVLEEADEDGNAMFFEQRSAEGPQTVFYRVRGYRVDSSNVARSGGRAPEAVSPFATDLRKRTLGTEPTPFLLALDDIVELGQSRSADDRNFVRNIALILADTLDERVETLIEDAATDLREPERLLVTVLQAAEIPARRVVGLPVRTEQAAVTPRIAIEAYFEDQWHRISPRTGSVTTDDVFIPLSYGEAPLISGEGTIGEPDISFSVRNVINDRLEHALWTSRADAPVVSWVSLLSLPLSTQIVFKAIFLVPIGALVIAFLRQMVGVSTFGTFMPVLIALSFRETGLFNGIGLFVGLVGAGLLLRAYFSKLHLLLVPRLTAVLAIVTLLMAFIALLGNAAEFPLGLSISLFPLVILTMTIERMSIMWEEVGAREALIRGAGSIFAAIIAFLIVSNEQIEYLAFVFPELLLIIVALAVLLGGYNGYKLSEYLRFNMFGQKLPGVEDTE